jgi:23S rRNA (adenine2503-C2)-methyltransferase
VTGRAKSGQRAVSARAPGLRPPAASACDSESPPKLLEIYRPDISKALAAESSPAYRYEQVYEHLLRRPMQAFSQATALPAHLRQALDGLGIFCLAPVGERTASDGTTKLLFSVRDGSRIETVVMPYRKRTTVCISSQVGCPVGCAFCATGAIGFHRNLSVTEIVDQVRAAAGLATDGSGRISNLVYMGMGEPLLNLQAVLDSIRVLADPRGMNVGHRSISVSTVGIPGAIVRLGQAEPQVNLALSLHASSDHVRALLIPKRYCHPLSDILAASWEHFAMTHRKLLIEYVLLGGVNDSSEDARRLAALLRGHVVTVNLLSWNPVPGSARNQAAPAGRLRRSPTLPSVFQPSSPASVAAFRDTLLDARIEAVIRRARGIDIEAACGQLAGRGEAYGQAAE